MSRSSISWPTSNFTRIPYAVYRDHALFDLEQERIFRGDTWNYLLLEAEIPNPGDFRTTYVGDTPVIVNRDEDGQIHALVNRCAHRGAIVRRESHGNDSTHVCCYHQWCYDCRGNLIGIPFMRGVKGKGGLPRAFDKSAHGLRKLRTEVRSGVVFGSFSDTVEPLADYLDDPMASHLDRTFHKPVRILGYQRQEVHGNWKLYTDNLRDPNHGGLLHMFQITFGIARLSQWGGARMDRRHRHNISFTKQGTDAEEGATSYGETARRDSGPRLEDPALLQYRPEWEDGLSLSIMSIFPNAVFQQIGNSLATRQIRPRSVDEFEIYWTYFGFADDDQSMIDHRLRQANLAGPAGLVSMEDGEAVEIVHRAIVGDRDRHSVVEFGNSPEIVDQDTLVTEVPMRGFWSNYYEMMGFGSGEAGTGSAQ